MSEQKYNYAENHTQARLLMAALSFIGGCVSLWISYGSFAALQNRAGEITVNDSSFGGVAMLLLFPIPLLLEWLARRRNWLLNKRQGIALVVACCVLVVAMHEGARAQYPAYFEAEGWQKCREYTTGGKSSRRIAIWRPQGQCGKISR